jgi:hypothetical protein
VKKYVAVLAIALVVATMCGAVAAQIPATKPPNAKITPLGPQAHRPPGDRPVMTGTIYGFVYWDSTLTSHLPSPVCSALSITVAVASKSPYGPFGAMGTQSHFTPIATVHPPLTAVNTTAYDGCAYAYDNAPLGQNLYVKLNLTQPLGTLMPATVAKNPAVGPIQFSNAPCSTLPPLTKATVGNLLGNWGSCQNVAYDVNLPLVIRQSLTILSSIGGMGGNQGSQSGPLLNQARPAGILNNAASQNTNSSSPANGMLLPAVTPAPAQTPSISQPGIAPGGSAQNVQMNPQPLPPKGDTGPSQTMSAGSMASSGTNSSPAQRGNRPVDAVLYTGTVSGFIYWDTSKTGFESSCNGVSVHANLDHGNWGSWQGAAGNLTYSANGPLAVCAYTVTGVPTGVPLDISPEVGWPYTAFGVNLWSLAAPGNQSGGSVAWGGEFLGEYDVITVQKTSCKALVSSKNFGSQSNLQSGPRSCGNQAANVNLILVSIAPQLSSITSGGSGNGAATRIAGAKRGGPNRILLNPQPGSSAQK